MSGYILRIIRKFVERPLQIVNARKSLSSRVDQFSNLIPDDFNNDKTIKNIETTRWPLGVWGKWRN